jgi:peptide/nickel transport system ATP-binding protein
MTPALDIDKLEIRTQARHAHGAIVHRTSLQLAPGARLTILGESGSGKSILAQAIMGTLPQGVTATGSIAVWGQAVDRMAAPARQALWGRALAMLPQEPWLALNPTMRSLAQVAEVPHRVLGQRWPAAQDAARAALGQVRLLAAAHKYPHQISGGMAQRVAFAATCASGARLLIADEPTKGLDAALRDQIGDLLSAHLHADHALITITHDVALARRLGGTVAVMLDGRIVEQGPASDVLEHPRHAYSQALVQADPAHWDPMAHTLPFSARTVVQAVQVSKSFDAHSLFAGVDLAVAQGEIVAVPGPSGCGKTTLGHILLGLERADSGQVHRPGASRPWSLQKLYQDPPAAFAPQRSLRDSLDDLVQRHRLGMADARELMRTLRLGDELLDRLPAQVSGGELQRFALLRVLLLRPAFVFADEPGSRLDPVTQKLTMQLLNDSAAAHRFGVVLVTHDAAVARNGAHRVARIPFLGAGGQGGAL